jgi:UDP-glucose 4-epimerase
VRAVVTGGAGFIGSNVVDALVARGDEVHVLDNLATGSRQNLNPGATFHDTDIRSGTDAVFAAAQPDVCLHLAAQADVGTSVKRPDYDAEVNVLGTVRVLEAARAHGTRIVFSSTGGAIYGECDAPASEEAPRRPISPYGIAKLAAEEYLVGWNRLYGMRHVALRFANVYGPRQLSTLEGGVVSIFLDRLAAGGRVTIFGDGTQTRDFIFVGDVVSAVLAAIEYDAGGIFNIGTGVATSINELYATCREVANSNAEPEYSAPRPGDVLHSVIDPSRADRELGWRPAHTLAEGLSLTWASVTA